MTDAVVKAAATAIGPDSPNGAKRARDAAALLTETLLSLNPEDTPAVFIQKWEGEEAAAYQARCRVLEILWRVSEAVEDITGRIFASPIQLQENVPVEIRGQEASDSGSEVKGLAENIDYRGQALGPFCRDWLAAGIGSGMAVVLVEHTPAVKASSAAGPTKDDEQKAGSRPYWILVPAKDWIPDVETIAGISRLVRGRRVEVTTEKDGEFGEKTVTRVRIYYRAGHAPDEIYGQIGGDSRNWAAYEVRVKLKDDAWATESSGTLKPHVEIPAVLFAPGKKLAEWVYAPCYFRLAKMVKSWIQIRSSLRELLDACAVVIRWAAGASEQELKQLGSAGNTTFWGFSRAEAKAGILEMEGKSSTALQDDLERAERRMDRMAREPLAMNVSRATSSATEALIDQRSAMSKALGWVVDFEDAVEQALGLTAVWLGLGADAGGEAQVNRDLGTFRDADLTDLATMRKNGDISRRTGWAEAQRRGVLGASFSPAAEERALQDEASQKEAAFAGALGQAGDPKVSSAAGDTMRTLKACMLKIAACLSKGDVSGAQMLLKTMEPMGDPPLDGAAGEAAFRGGGVGDFLA